MTNNPNSLFYKNIIFFLFAIVPFLAFYIFSYTFFPYITGRGFAFRLIIEVSLLLYLLISLYDKNFLPTKSKLLIGYAWFIVLLFIANIFASNPYLSFFSGYERLEGFWTHLHLFLYFFILISTFREQIEWRKMFAWFIVASMPVIIFGFLQLSGQKEFILSKYVSDKNWTTIEQNATTTQLKGADFIEIFGKTYQSGARIDSKLGNPAYAAIYYLWSFFFFVLIASKSLIENKNNKWKSLSGWQEVIGLFISTSIILLEDIVNTFKYLNSNGQELFSPLLINIYPLLMWMSYIAFIYFAIRFVKRSANNDISPIWYTIGAISAVISLVYTQTRGTYLGLLIGVGVAILILFIKRKSIVNKISRKIIIVLFGIGVLLFIGLGSIFTVYKDRDFVKQNVFLNRISTINIAIANPFLIYHSLQTENYKEMLNTIGDGTIVSRILNISIAINGLLDNPKTMLIGWGQENYPEVFSKYHDARMYAQEPWFDRTHNVFMDWLVAGGIIGLISYLSLYIISLWMLWKNNKDIWENTILTSAITGYFIHNVFVFDNLISYIFFVFILGYIAHLSRNKVALLSDKVVNSLNPKITIIISTLVVGIAFFIFVYNPLSASINGILANQDISRYGNGELKNVSPIIKYYKGAIESGSLGTTEIIVNAIQNYNAVIQLSDEKKKNVTDHNKDISDYNKFLLDNMSKLEKRNINSQSINIILASFYAMNDYEKAKIYMDKALSLGGDKKPSTLLSFAQISYQKGEIDKALEYAQKAYDLENSNEQAKSILESINSLQIVNKK